MFNTVKDAANIGLSLTGRYSARYRDIWIKRAAWVEQEDKTLIPQWSRTHNALIIQVSKAAGSGQTAALFEDEKVEAHCPASAYRAIDPDFYAQAFVFAFVRNPWDRLVSAFHHIRFKDYPYNRTVVKEDFSDIEDFDTFLDRLRGFAFRHKMLTRMHFMPQTYFICDRTGEIIADRICRFERLQTEYQSLSEHFPTPKALPTINTGKQASKDYRSFYKQDWAVDLVRSMYARDCDLFDYSFELAS